MIKPYVILKFYAQILVVIGSKFLTLSLTKSLKIASLLNIKLKEENGEKI